MKDSTSDTTLDGAIGAIIAALEREEGPMTDKKRRIVEAAIHCFAENGFAATATNTIARRAGVAEGTIFRHFATKKDLLVRLVRPLFAHSLLPLALEELREESRRATGGLRGLMKTMMMNRLALADRYAPLVRILIQELKFHEELRAAIPPDFVNAIRSGAAEMLAPFIEAGEIRPVEPVDFLRPVISQMIGYYLLRNEIAPQLPWDDEIEVGKIADLILDGLRPR